MSDHASVQRRTHGLLEEILGSVAPPEQGAWVFSYGTISLGVAVAGEDDANVAVFTILMRDVPKSAELLDVLNDVNSELKFAQIYWEDGSVYLTTHLVGHSIDREELRTALQVVGNWGDQLDETLAERFGSLAQDVGVAWSAQTAASEEPSGVPPPPPGAVGAT
jgi:hypothetical protein